MKARRARPKDGDGTLLPLLRSFGGEILAHDPWIHPSVLREMGVTPASLEECFEKAAAVFLLGAVTTENAGGIGRSYFEKMQKGGIVFVLESQSDGGNFLRGALGKIGDRAVFDLAILTEGLAQKAAGVGFALDGDFAFIEIH